MTWQKNSMPDPVDRRLVDQLADIFAARPGGQPDADALGGANAAIDELVARVRQRHGAAIGQPTDQAIEPLIRLKISAAILFGPGAAADEGIPFASMAAMTAIWKLRGALL